MLMFGSVVVLVSDGVDVSVFVMVTVLVLELAFVLVSVAKDSSLQY
jgi:hypothetical protein